MELDCSGQLVGDRRTADHVGTEQQHRDALIRWDPEKYKRVHALTYADLGDSLAAQARADEAVAACPRP